MFPDEKTFLKACDELLIFLKDSRVQQWKKHESYLETEIIIPMESILIKKQHYHTFLDHHHHHHQKVFVDTDKDNIISSSCDAEDDVGGNEEFSSFLFQEVNNKLKTLSIIEDEDESILKMTENNINEGVHGQEVQYLALNMNIEENKSMITTSPGNPTYVENIRCREYFYRLKLHIVYSSSYQCPVLYFNAYHSHDGSFFTLEEVMRNLVIKSPSTVQHYKDYQQEVVFDYPMQTTTLSSSKILSPDEAVHCTNYTFITQMQHPILGTMFYCLHPCMTSVVMGEILKKQNDSKTKSFPPILLCWLSIFGQFIGYYLEKSNFHVQ